MKRLTAAILIGVLALVVIAVGESKSDISRQFAIESSSFSNSSVSPSLTWTHLSSKNGDLPVSGPSEQTLSLLLDIDKDGLNDFVVGGRKVAPALVWFRRDTNGWTKYVIDGNLLNIEAGGAFADIDGDGDLDVVAGEDISGNHLYWWENPYPNYVQDVSWTRREIKNSGGSQHHDQAFGDFDGDGKLELAFWNQRAQKLFIAEIPENPEDTEPWLYTEIFSGQGEGMATADIDGDGKTDLLAGGFWFKHNGGTSYTAYPIDISRNDARVVAGDLKKGGGVEVVMANGDSSGRLKWYECVGDPRIASSWVSHDMLGFNIDHGHSLQLADFNSDGNVDIFVGEMRLDGTNEDAKMWIFWGEGNGNFTKTEVATGYDVHEAKVGDLNGDGTIDIFAKPYNGDTPRLDIWLSERTSVGG